MAEGGIGWVAMLLDRLDNLVDRSGYGLGWDERPADVLRRSFWFCTIDDPSTIDTRHAIGVENIMVEVDYPHGDSTWPDTQAVIQQAWGHLPAGGAPSHVLRERRCPLPPPAARHGPPTGLTPTRPNRRRLAHGCVCGPSRVRVRHWVGPRMYSPVSGWAYQPPAASVPPSTWIVWPVT